MDLVINKHTIQESEIIENFQGLRTEGCYYYITTQDLVEMPFKKCEVELSTIPQPDIAQGSIIS